MCVMQINFIIENDISDHDKTTLLPSKKYAHAAYHFRTASRSDSTRWAGEPFAIAFITGRLFAIMAMLNIALIVP